jgi:hypothetical protein
MRRTGPVRCEKLLGEGLICSERNIPFPNRLTVRKHQRGAPFQARKIAEIRPQP